MPSCENCGRKWTWKRIVLKTLKLTNKANCPYCGQTQYIVAKSRKVTRIYSFLPAFIIIVSAMIFDLDGWDILLLTPMLILMALFVYPFFMKLSKDNEAGLLRREAAPKK
ncbi:CXXC-20-CXXC protein [Planomicrobium stackebrandtii]|uniref:CXXC-20-CXXC protein n=1 Tax=Planomicrobium stackebrandtii TaxID=253160 RepID=A0ABU0GX88_9BACL|nr:TIGR04104 family putative zinc finger protein [Planomicrobium stackebrandtii]MDQ0429396.1 CXXC-20-CXXC protein [Planomicrobium stackebrandtii]